MNGKGMFVWPDGRRFRGQYKKDKKEGYGVFEHTNGNKYVGNWQDGLQHGSGVFITADGSQHEGQWNKGKLAYFLKEMSVDSTTKQQMD